MALRSSYDSDGYWANVLRADIKPAAREKPDSFIDRMHQGEFGKGYNSLTEARMHHRKGTVVLPAENEKYYVVSQWAAKRYWRYVDGQQK